VAKSISTYYAAGVRHVSLDIVGPYEERHGQLQWFAPDVLPLLADLEVGKP